MYVGVIYGGVGVYVVLPPLLPFWLLPLFPITGAIHFYSFLNITITVLSSYSSDYHHYNYLRNIKGGYWLIRISIVCHPLYYLILYYLLTTARWGVRCYHSSRIGEISLLLRFGRGVDTIVGGYRNYIEGGG